MSDKRKNQKPDKLLNVAKRSPVILNEVPNAGRSEESRFGNLSLEKKHDAFLFLLFAAFGVYQTIIYWGHQPVPHFDFHCFGFAARELLSFNISDYKRVPLTGLLQILLGKITGGTYPDLVGGWLLNSISHVLTFVFLWLAGRKIIGRNAIWFAIIAIINPFGLQLLTESIAETPMLFFIWITLYLTFIRSKWAYFFASLGTMIRYECAMLILGIFVYEMIEGENKKQRIMAFVYSGLASIPLALWMLGTFMHSSSTGGTHYFAIFSKDYVTKFTGGADKSTGFLLNANILWQTGFMPLLQISPKASESAIKSLMIFSQVFVALTFFFGSIYGLIKKQWKILVMLIFFVPYFVSHAKYPYPIHRYYATVFGIVMLISIYGIMGFWSLVKNFVPKAITICLQILLLIVSLIWAMILWPWLSQLAYMSKASVSLPYISILIMLLAFAATVYIWRKDIFPRVVIVSLMLLMIVSNQFTIASVVGNGDRDIEFKLLADWYCQNAKPNEKLVTTVPVIIAIMAPQYKDNFIHTNTFDANSPEEFARQCYERGITYVAWDSRMGMTPGNFYYQSWKMQNISPLASGQDVGPYQFITQLKANQRRYVNLYRLRPLNAH
jgi:hypothetical protein